jgi:hypothetical protein
MQPLTADVYTNYLFRRREWKHLLLPAAPVYHSAESQTCAIIPNGGCLIADVIVDGVSVGCPETYTFSDVRGNHTIGAPVFSGKPVAFSGCGTGTRQLTKAGTSPSADSTHLHGPDDGSPRSRWRHIQGVLQ